MEQWISSNGLINTGYETEGRLPVSACRASKVWAFTYDAADRITQITNGIDNTLTQNFGYDYVSRLTSVYSSVENESYQYDANGNRNTGTVNGVTQTYTYSPTSNQLTGISGGDSTQYGYDANGNTTLVNGAASYQYDPYTRLDAAGGAADYVNPEGQRLRKAGGSTGTTYFAPGTDGTLLAEDDNGTWVDYVRLNGRLIGRISAGQISAIHDDQVGRPEVVTDASQNVVWLAQNFPFTQKVTTANITLNLGFPGQYYDAERQTWNNGYHDYSSVLGRYIESDPSGLAGGINTYAYVGDNPLTGVDPFGLLTEQQIAAIVFNETRSLSGSNILQARIDVASAVINGSNAYGDNGRPKTASDVANVPSAEESAYQNSLEATKTALCENKNGQDPTDGATHFNLRPNDSTGPFFGSPLSTQSGPFNNSFPTSDLPATGIYVNTYR